MYKTHAIYTIKSCIFALKTSKNSQNMQDLNVFYS